MKEDVSTSLTFFVPHKMAWIRLWAGTLEYTFCVVYLAPKRLLVELTNRNVGTNKSYPSYRFTKRIYMIFNVSRSFFNVSRSFFPLIHSYSHSLGLFNDTLYRARRLERFAPRPPLGSNSSWPDECLQILDSSFRS